MILRFLGIILMAILVNILPGCSPAGQSAKAPSAQEMEISQQFFDNLIQNNPAIANAFTNKKAWNVQVIYTQIDRNSKNKPRFTTYTFNNEPAYFYPASTVKLPIALLSLQKLGELKSKGIDKNTSMITEADYAGQSAVYNDPNTADGRPTIANYIRRLFLVSDNDASNRLYEFLGQEYINTALHKKGYSEAQILHRLAISLTEDENRHTNPVRFYDSLGKMIYAQDLKSNKAIYDSRNDFAGLGYMSNGRLVNEPMNFSKKNRISLHSLHTILKSTIFPESVKRSQRIRLTEEDRDFVLKAMSQFPAESKYPAYDSIAYPDAYAKFILYGSGKEQLPKNIRIFNKVGNAYGQLVDVAYVCDYENKVEFLVSAAITCNTDGILNDDKYDYNSIGFPFLKSLGEALYAYELKRTKKYLPDLTSLRYHYNK